MADKSIVAQYSPGDVVRLFDLLNYSPHQPQSPWTVLRVLADGSLLLRRGDERRVASPEEVRR